MVWGKALGWMAGTLTWLPGAPGKRTLYDCPDALQSTPCGPGILSPRYWQQRVGPASRRY